MESNAFTVSENGAVCTVTLARPESGNRLTMEDIGALGKAIRRLGEAPAAKIVVLRALGDSFCLGRDPGAGGKGSKTALAIRASVTEPILDLYADLRATPVPVIAVVQGEARGFGCAMVGQCDLAIAADTARFSLPEMDINLPPTLAISAMVGKLPPKRLLHMVYTRRQIDAQDALAMGLVSEVVIRSELDKAAGQTFACFTDRSRAALCAVKEYMAIAPYTDPAGASRLAANLLSAVLSSQGST
jgi:enoyl-CoA hydratase